tara:strand:- start:1516 stop:1767 length:252 start_codon:yes stop_codon:yes gene_type:complete
MDTTEFDHQRDQFSDQAEGRAAAYAFIREIVALMNSTNLSKAEKREELDEFITHANYICHSSGNGQKDCYAKLDVLQGLRRLI